MLCAGDSETREQASEEELRGRKQGRLSVYELQLRKWLGGGESTCDHRPLSLAVRVTVGTRPDPAALFPHL